VRWVAAVALGCLVGAACVPTTRDAPTYEAKAATTAEKAGSAVASGELLADLAAAHRLLGPFASASTAGAEEEADAIRSTFDAIQPPDHRSEQLREELDKLLESASSALSEMRITARRGQVADLAGFRKQLRSIGDNLDQFQQDHS
jgi:hypothetical protein